MSEFTEKHRGLFFGMGIRHSGQVYLPTKIQEMLKESGRISPSCRLYEPEAESKSWAGEKTPLKMGDILYSPEICPVLTGPQSGSPQTCTKNEKGVKRIS